MDDSANDYDSIMQEESEDDDNDDDEFFGAHEDLVDTDGDVDLARIEAEQLESFREDCRLLGENHPTVESIPVRGDDQALLVGRALVGNTHLKSLLLYVRTDLTPRGAGAITSGIKQANIESISICHESPLSTPEVSRILYMEAIQIVPQLSIDYSLTDQDANQLGQALAKNTSIEQLIIRDNHLTPTGAEALAKGICTSKVRHLQINGPERMNDSTDVKRILYSQGIHQSDTIRCLSLHYDIGDIHSLTEIIPMLDGMTISNCNDLHEVAQGLNKGMSNASHLTTLDLSRCSMSDASLVAISPGLSANQSIQTLNLSNNCITDQGLITFVLEHWPCNSPLCHLNVSSNLIGPTGAQQLLKASQSHPNLQRIDLSLNPNIGYMGLQLIAQELPQVKLKNLNLLGCVQWVNHADASATSNAAPAQFHHRDAASKALSQGMKANVHLQTLNLEAMNLLSSDQEVIQLYLDLNQHGRYLLSSNPSPGVTPTLWCHIFAKCHENASIIYFFLHEQPMQLVSTAAAPVAKAVVVRR